MAAQKAKAHAAKKAAKTLKRRKRKAAAAPRGPDDDYSVTEWCRKRRVSKPTFYGMLRDGTGPKTLKLRKRRTVSKQADEEWQRARESEPVSL